MYYLIFFCILYVSAAIFFYRYFSSSNISSKKIFAAELIILFISIYLYLYLSILSPNGDSVFIKNLINSLTYEGFSGFYDNAGITYPPLFNYLYYVIGKILIMCGIPLSWTYRSFIFVVKLPCICCIFGAIYIIYRNVQKNIPENKRILPLFLMLFNPGYILVTAYICQFDALYSLFVLLTIDLLLNHHLKMAYFTFTASILFKFQALFIGPILLLAIIDQVILNNFSWKRFFSHLATGLTAIACMILSYLPFINSSASQTMYRQPLFNNFTSSIAGYGRASTNAYNLWTLLGRNLRYDSENFGPFSCLTWGIIFIILVAGSCIFFFIKASCRADLYPMLAALMISGIFCFSVRMMARYLYPALALLFLGYAVKPSRNSLLCTIFFTLAFFLNTWGDYMLYPYDVYNDTLLYPYIVSVFMLCIFAFLVCTLILETKKETN